MTIPSQEIFSEVVIQPGGIEGDLWIPLLKKVSHRFALITDHQVRDLVGEALKKRGEKEGLIIDIFSVPPGEKSKSREWKERLENQMLLGGFGRDSAIIALGGGVVSDLAGFVAATYYRGIPFISIPTTLLGQVDASIGGKVAVNTPKGKNLIGAFYQPRFIFIDTHLLKTLPPAELLSGMAEVIKYALIASKSLFEKLNENTSLEEYIHASCKIKIDVIQKDPQEKGLRRILNFGHTVAHALETLMEYKISHGEAVALGMLAESRMSWKLGYLKEGEFLQIQAMLEKFGFSLRLPSKISGKELVEIMRRDKKAFEGKPRVVLLNKIGEAHPFDGAYCRLVEGHVIEEALEWLHLK